LVIDQIIVNFIPVNTKDRILQEALGQFNSKGLENVSTRDIAKSLKVYQGNLTYYYPMKNDLIKALSVQMIDEIDAITDSMVTNEFTLRDMHALFKEVFNVNLKFRCIAINFGKIASSDPELNQYFMDKMQNRKELMRAFLVNLQKNDSIQGEGIELLSDGFTELMNLVTNYWLPESIIYHNDKSNEERILHYVNMMFLLFRPYLTPKGKEEFRLLV